MLKLKSEKVRTTLKREISYSNTVVAVIRDFLSQLIDQI